MKLPAIARIPLLLLLLSGCSLAPLARPTPSAVPTASPASTATAFPVATPSATVTQPPPTQAIPPRGYLGGEGDPVEGWLGSYCWQGTCADAPGVPPIDMLPAVYTSDWEMEFSLSDGATFVRWQATYTSDDDGEPITLGQGGEVFDPDARPSAAPELLSVATFDSPPGGDSIVIVQVFFDGGDLSYAWHVRLPRLPPTAEIRLPNGTSVEGYLNGWYYDGAGGDGAAIPFLPALDIRDGAELTFAFAEGDQFAFVQVQYKVATDSKVVELASGGTYIDPDTNSTPGPPLTSFNFNAPPKGDWDLGISVRFAGELGDASYYWHALVE